MKKRILVFVILLFIFGIPFNCYTYADIDNIRAQSKNPYIPLEHSREELYQDIYMTLLLPYIQDEVDKYYEEYLSTSPIIAPYSVKILEAYRANGYRGFDFRLKIELHPYVGPHLEVGLDYITIRISSTVNVKVEKFEHIKSYKLPWNYQDII